MSSPAPMHRQSAAPACGFIGWGPESEALLTALQRRFPELPAQAVRLAGTGRDSGASAGEPLRALPSVEGIFRAAQYVFAEGGAAALQAHLPMIRLAISDRHVLVLLGTGWSLPSLLEQLRERKLARCLLLPSSPGNLGAVAYHLTPYFAPAESAAFRALFEHLDLCVELREEQHFEVMQGLVDFAPAAFYTAMEAMADGVVMTGFSRSAALQILASLLHGAAQRVLEGNATPGQLREQALEIDVAAAGLMELESAGIRGALMRAVQRAVRKPRSERQAEQEAARTMQHPPVTAVVEPFDYED